MRIEQEIDIPAGIDEVWSFLEDVPRVATCLPGANLTDVIDENTFDGTVSVKVGPILVNYQGRLVIQERDVATRTVRMKADGKDRKGAGAANAKIEAVLVETDATHTHLSVGSDVQLSGRIATLGRGVQDVAGKIFGEFASRMSAEISASPAAPPPAAEPVPEAPENTPRSISGSTGDSPASSTASSTASEGDSGPGPARHLQAVDDPTEPEPPPVIPRATSDLPIPPAEPGSTAAPTVAPAQPAAAKPVVITSASSPNAPVNAPIKVGGMFWSILLDKLRRLFSRRSGADR